MAAHSDAFVFFGATGDLAYKKIFPALQSMVRQNTLNVPVIGVAADDGRDWCDGSSCRSASQG